MDLKTSELRENFPTNVLKIPHLIHIKGGDDAAQHEALSQREHAPEDEIQWGFPPEKLLCDVMLKQGNLATFLVKFLNLKT